MSDLKDDKYESFLRLYKESESCIYRYILALLPNFSAAEDIMQETMLVMWRKYGQFREGSSFAAWGMQIARFCVLKHRRSKKPGFVHLSNEAIDNLAKHNRFISSNEGGYVEALEECTGELSENNKKMISLRYVENMKTIDIANPVRHFVCSGLKKVQKNTDVKIGSLREGFFYA